MIRRICSNPDCSQSLPLNETYFRRRGNGMFRTDCRICENKSRQQRRERNKHTPKTSTIKINSSSDGKTTEEVLRMLRKMKPDTQPNVLHLDFSNKESIESAISKVIGLMTEMIETKNNVASDLVSASLIGVDPGKEETPVTDEMPTDAEIRERLIENYLIVDGVVYRVQEVDDSSECTQQCDLAQECSNLIDKNNTNSLLKIGKCHSTERVNGKEMIWKKTSLSPDLIKKILDTPESAMEYIADEMETQDDMGKLEIDIDDGDALWDDYGIVEGIVYHAVVCPDDIDGEKCTRCALNISCKMCFSLECHTVSNDTETKYRNVYWVKTSISPQTLIDARNTHPR